MNAQNKKEVNCDDKIGKIIFEKKNTKATIKMGINLGVILIIALVVVSLFFNFIIRYRYGDVIDQLKNRKYNNAAVIVDYTEIIEKVSKSMVTIGQSQENLLSTGKNTNNISGVIITSDGLILTNYYGIKDFDNIYAKLSGDNDDIVKGRVLIKNEAYDLALIEIDYDEELYPIQLADSKDVVEGQGIAILGNTYIDKRQVDIIVPGIITSRYGLDENGVGNYNLLQISAPVNGENTGGPICNANGQLVGIASLTLTQKANNSGLYYGIELDGLDNIISSTIEIKEVLGITEGGLLLSDKSNYKGFYVGQVEKDGNAYKAGIKPTDIIISIDGHNVISSEEVTNILLSKNKGDNINCIVLSDGEIKDIQIKLYKKND